MEGSSNTFYDNNDSRIKQTQSEVEEVKGILRDNLEKVLERDQKLSELDHRADALNQGAFQFEKHAGQLKRKMWWKNMKMMLIMGGIAAFFLIILIVWISSSVSDDSSDSAKEKTSN